MKEINIKFKKEDVETLIPFVIGRKKFIIIEKIDNINKDILSLLGSKELLCLYLKLIKKIPLNVLSSLLETSEANIKYYESKALKILKRKDCENNIKKIIKILE